MGKLLTRKEISVPIFGLNADSTLYLLPHPHRGYHPRNSEATLKRRDDLFTEPSATPTIKCLSCGETLLYGLKECRYCGVEVNPEYAYRSALYHTYITRACSLANNLITMRPVMWLVAIGGLVMPFMDPPLVYRLSPFIITALRTAAVIRWRWKHGEISLPDEEFTNWQRVMKREAHIWLALVALQSIILAVSWSRGARW